MYNPTKNKEPKNPHSSAKGQKIKSVSLSGTWLASTVDNVASPYPFPDNPPEPTAAMARFRL